MREKCFNDLDIEDRDHLRPGDLVYVVVDNSDGGFGMILSAPDTVEARKSGPFLVLGRDCKNLWFFKYELSRVQ